MFNQSTTVGGSEGGSIDQPQQHSPPGANGPAAMQGTQPRQQSTRNSRKEAYVKITEQPASKALRFRYECEGRSAGSIPGVNSTPENKTFPTIEIVGYKGRAVVVVSCVTKDPPYRPHPHNLVGKEGCKKGVCTVEINSETMRAVFSNLGIQCVKKKDIEQALRAREEIRVDPFKTGFSHRFQPSSIDLNSVRLCFQVFLENDQVKGRFTRPLPPVVSDPIYDKKAMSDLVICTLCSCSSTVAGGRDIILLCEKVAKEDISIRFFEEHDGQLVWEAFGDFQHTDVHKQTAIKFRTPRYRSLEIDQPVKVCIQLRRPSDGATSEALPFDYLPLDSDPAVLKRKRQKFGGDPNMHLLRHFQAQERHQKHQDLQPQDGRAPQAMEYLNLAQGTTIKSEPRDVSPIPHYMFGNISSYRLPENSPSPQPLSPQNMNYASNTPSPYSMATGGTLLSPNHQYGGNISPNMMTEFGNYHHQIAAGDMNSYNPMQQQGQQWNTDVKQQMPPINNLNSTNCNMEVLLTATTATTQTHEQHQQQWSMHGPSSSKHMGGMGSINQLINSQGPNSSSTSNMEGPNVSSLLDMDSEQLMTFNSNELQALTL